MTRKKRAAPEPPIFTGAEKLEIDDGFRSCCKPRPSPKTRPAPPPPLPRKTLLNKAATSVIDNDPNDANDDNSQVDSRSNNNYNNSNSHSHSHHNSNTNSNKKVKPARQIIRREYFSDDDDFDDLSFDSATPPPTSKTPTTARPASSSGRESPNESICTTDSGVNSDLDFVKNRRFSTRSKTTPLSPTNSIVSQDSLENNDDDVIECSHAGFISPPVPPPPMAAEYLSDTPPLYDIRRPSQLDLIQEARRMLRKSIVPIRSPSPTETIASEWSDDPQAIFHINEKDDIPPNPIVDENFAGVRVLGSEQGSNSSTSTIRSHRGTIRGVKNRVRAGIATFLRDQRTKVMISSIKRTLTV